jgi:hypothetical protein
VAGCSGATFLQESHSGADSVGVKNRPGQRLRVQMRSYWRRALRRSSGRLLAALVVGLVAGGIILAMPMPQWEHGYFMELLTASLVVVVAWTLRVRIE